MKDKKQAPASNSAYLSASNVAEPTSVKAPPGYYKLVIKLLKPIYRLVLWHRHNKAKKNNLPVADYKQEIKARFGGQYPDPPVVTAIDETETTAHHSAFKGASIWCHAVSLGETNTIAPMLKVMLQQGAKLWVTNTTQTGFARTQALFAEAITNQQMVHTFVPVDDQAVINKFIAQAKPDLAMFVETELWANILAVLKKSGIPSVLVNARLSQKSYENYAKYQAVTASMMHNLTMIIAQDADSAIRFRRLGTEVVKIRRADSLKWSTGSSQPQLSYDQSDLKALQAKFCKDPKAIDRPIWVAGSTHEGEEKAVIEAHKQLISQSQLASALLILVPRHPERFEAVADLLQQQGVVYRRRSEQQLIEADTEVYLADTMGELTACYQLSDVALVGGSLVNIGGHNPIEAASFAKPVIMGPYTQSCHEVVAALHQVGALKVVAATQKPANKKQLATDNLPKSNLVDTLAQWLSHPEEANHAGKQGQLLVEEKSDAMQKQLAMIENLIIAHQSTTADSYLKETEVDMDHFEVRKRDETEPK